MYTTLACGQSTLPYSYFLSSTDYDVNRRVLAVEHIANDYLSVTYPPVPLALPLLLRLVCNRSILFSFLLLADLRSR